MTTPIPGPNRSPTDDAAAVLVERRGQILLITLNRPEARNAVNQALAAGLAAAIDELDGDEALRAGVLTGAGRGFCAGFDLKGFMRGESPFAGDRGFAGICRRPPEKPLVAAIEGFAVAGGLEVALSCDLLIAARGAKLAIPEVKVGLVAAAGALMRLPRRLPHHVAMQMALTGDPISAERAWELGLVNELCEPGETVGRALELAERVTANAPIALKLSKQIALTAPQLPEEEGWLLQDRVAGPVMTSEDAREGASAFAERRAPRWRGR
jgi:enoyl-CoA hydratase